MRELEWTDIFIYVDPRFKVSKTITGQVAQKKMIRYGRRVLGLSDFFTRNLIATLPISFLQGLLYNIYYNMFLGTRCLLLYMDRIKVVQIRSRVWQIRTRVMDN